MDTISEQGGDAGDASAVTRTPLSYVREISSLQANLHQSIEDLEHSNKECVKLAEENQKLKSEVEEVKVKARKLGAENSALKRRLQDHEEGVNIPRPGPPLKSFDDLTPKHQKRATNKLQAQVNKTSEERRILPTRLSAFLTHRYLVAKHLIYVVKQGFYLLLAKLGFNIIHSLAYFILLKCG